MSARLNFTGDANVYDNKLGDEQRNVCLDVDSELVIQAVTLNSGKKIVLTDNASEVNGIAGFVTGERDEKPDEEIPLCQAYNEIFDLMN